MKAPNKLLMKLQLECGSPVLSCLFLLDIDFQVLIKFFNSEENLYVQNSFLFIYQQQVIKVKVCVCVFKRQSKTQNFR